MESPQHPEWVLSQFVQSFHAHVYFQSAAEEERATHLRDWIDTRFPLELGRWRREPFGPHPVPSFQVAFENELFGTFVPWLALNRLDLAILVHPNTGRPREDHSRHALWMGSPLNLRLTTLPSLSAGRATPALVPNTRLARVMAER